MPGGSVILIIASLFIRLDIIGAFSGYADYDAPPQQRAPHWPRPVYRRVDAQGEEQELDRDAVHWQRASGLRAQSHARMAKLMPAALLESQFRQIPPGRGAVSLLARTDNDVHVENNPISSRHIITMALRVDVRWLNLTLLRSFREGVAASLDIPPRHVHINRLNEQKNGIELYVSSERAGASEPVSPEEVIRSLNVNILHRRLEPFGITEVSSEKNVQQGQHERDDVWTKEGFYAVVIFLTIFIIIVTCLMVLYRLKEKVEYSERQLKEALPARDVRLTPIPAHGGQPPPLSLASSMVQAERAPKPAAPVPAPATAPVSARYPAAFSVGSLADPSSAPARPPAPAEVKPCLSSSPFRMKPAAGLQERRGSNVSLVLDMSALGSVEPLSSGVATPRERAAQEYLQSAGRTLSRQQLRELVLNTQRLHAEFAEIPMNFVDPKELDIPSHGTKNRYKTILPNPHSRVVLRTKNTYEPLSSYINANYIRGYLGDEKAYIATQGPMINTVNDFWQMAWQEECPVMVMITKLKEKNEKCVLYWPERRGIYGKVEVLINNIRECEHYTVRSLTLKQGGQSRRVQHYWYTSWPDHKTPDSAQPLLQLMTDVEEDKRASGSQGPIVVHCSAGIGRTGCFIATSIGCRQLQLKGVVDVLGIVCQLRSDRGGMIQTGEQYEFVHHALSLYETRLSADTGQ